jgi:membrane protease YdiL (CAAX protease family)
MHTEPSTPQAVPWTERDVWLGLALLVLLLVIATGLAFMVRRLAFDLDLGWLVGLGELLLLAPVWWLALRKYRAGWGALGLRGFTGEMLGLGCGLMLLSFVFNMAYGLFLALFGLRIQPDLIPIFAQLSSPWPLLVGGALVAPLVEEIFFRGFVFGGLSRRYGWRRAALVSAALFALIHFTPTAILPIFLLGCIFAYLYRRSGSLWPGILMHMATNTLALAAAYLLASGKLPG